MYIYVYTIDDESNRNSDMPLNLPNFFAASIIKHMYHVMPNKRESMAVDGSVGK